MEISAEQLEQAIGQVFAAVDWSDPPKSDTVSPGQRRRSNDQALQIVFGCARKALQVPPPEEKPEVELAPSADTEELLAENLEQPEPIHSNGAS